MATLQGPFYKSLGQNIRIARNAAGITQARLAAEIGLTRTSVTNIESGKQPLEVHVLLKIAQTLECELMTLVPKPSSDLGQAAEKLAKLPVDVQAWVASVITTPEKPYAR